jgi:tellurite methyltransferase
MDKLYWEEYYSKHAYDKEICINSSFAKFCEESFFQNKTLNIVDVGSGNGRDAIYFSRMGHKVIAIDQSSIAIEAMSASDGKNRNLLFMQEDFVKYDFNLLNSIDVFYSRFTIHAINKHDEGILLPKIYNSLNIEGLFCVEARTTRDSLYGVGSPCGDNTFLTDHRRRFIDAQVFLQQVLALGFKLLFFIEEDNLSVYQGDNPTLMRVVLKK